MNYLLFYDYRENGFLPVNFEAKNGVLRIESIRSEDAGIYICSASRVTENVIPIKVEIMVQRQRPQAPASVRIDSESVVLFEGQSFSVECEASGNPLPNIKWTKVFSFYIDFITISKFVTLDCFQFFS